MTEPIDITKMSELELYKLKSELLSLLLQQQTQMQQTAANIQAVDAQIAKQNTPA
jgi:hypothetical protein